MTNYRITSKGKRYIHNPPDGRIGNNYFKNLILIYLVVENKIYEPSEFKEYVQSQGILKDKDWEPMATRNYPIWKHHVDAAKQGLEQLLVKKQNGTFSISDKKFDDVRNRIANYIEIIEQSEPEFSPEKDEYPPPDKVTTTITRVIRDTVLSNRVKEERNYQCQVCGIRLIIKGKGYAETHHVKPLGHGGPDVKTNMLVLCPNHHVLFDYGEIAISADGCEILVDKKCNKIFSLIPPAPKKEYVEYPYNKIYRK